MGFKRILVTSPCGLGLKFHYFISLAFDENDDLFDSALRASSNKSFYWTLKTFILTLDFYRHTVIIIYLCFNSNSIKHTGFDWGLYSTFNNNILKYVNPVIETLRLIERSEYIGTRNILRFDIHIMVQVALSKSWNISYSGTRRFTILSRPLLK